MEIESVREKEVASRKELFELLYHILERYNERYVSAVMSNVGVSLVIIGWLLTSNTVQGFFKVSVTGSISVVIIILVLIIIYSHTILRVYKVNHQVFEQIKKLNYVEEEYLQHHYLPTSYKYIGLGLNVCLYLIIAALVSNARWSFL
jgi:hypothetical protein